MKYNYLIFTIMAITLLSCGKRVEWVSTTENEPWVAVDGLKTTAADVADVQIDAEAKLQTIEGFGGCFNELGWTSLSLLSDTDRENIINDLFSPGIGANFTICRMPVGANDFSRDWYSYDETEGDFDLKDFRIDNDKETLIPFIHAAQKQNPNLKIWASPWSPPTWMKWNKHYACATTRPAIPEKFRNNLPTDKQGKEGTNMFIQEDAYFKTYANYFSKFVEAYANENIKIAAIMPQNEFNSCQIFPSCTWTAAGLATFIGQYLGPAMEAQNIELMFGTMERPTEALVDTILNDPLAGKYIKGVGFQWAGKGAIAGIHKRYPNLRLYQSEQECGDGKNDWKYCNYAWTLMKHYLSSGASAYMYWNISLEEGGFSRWGWQQNSLVTVDTATKTFKYNHEYYLLKHVSHYVQPGAQLLKTEGKFENLLAFVNPDKSIVVVMQNDSLEEKQVTVKVGDQTIKPLLKPSSFNTFVIR